ncbi:MAG: hypothetical protein IT184_15150 [Acidobacteria bacterium]|nr:hypothetical protein [Acidobacteriota bacterium]
MIDASPQQGRGPAGPPPIGVVYVTAMQRPDAALALAMLCAMADQRLARVGSVCVSGAGFEAAVFCDLIVRLFVPNERNGNQALAVGLTVSEPMPADPPMVRAAVARRNGAGEPLYRRGLQRIADTSQAEAVIRNGVTFSAESVVVLSAPATSLARTLDLPGTREEYAKRVKRLVVTDTSAVRQDLPALLRIFSDWPTPIAVCGADVGASLKAGTDVLDQAFAGFPAHPAVDAYRAFKTPPYEVPLDDLAAVHYAVKPESGLLDAGAAGNVNLGPGGAFAHTAGAGRSRMLSVAAGKAPEARAALLKLASATPAPPAPARGR